MNNNSKYILPPLTVPRPTRQYPKFRKFDVPGESDDLNDAMIAEDTRYAEPKRHGERESVLLDAVKIQQKISEERAHENRELKRENRELERRLREMEEENLRLRMQLDMKEEKEAIVRSTYDRLVDRLLEAVLKTRTDRHDPSFEDQLKRLSTELFRQSLDGKISATPPSEPR